MTIKTPFPSGVGRKFHTEATRISAFGDISYVSQEKILDPLDKLQQVSELSLEIIIEAMISWCQKEYSQDLFAQAYGDFQNLTGRVFYDEEFYHQRVNYFLLHFLFERNLNISNQTPYEFFLKSKYFLSLEPDKSLKIQTLDGFIHSIFLIHKNSKEKMILKDMLREKQSVYLCNDAEYIGMIPGGMIQGFLFRKDLNSYALAPGFLLHPKVVYGVMKKILKDMIKKDDWTIIKMIGLFSKQNLNFLRRRHLDAKKIYLSQDI